MRVPVLWTGGSLGSLLTSSRLNDFSHNKERT